MRIIKTSGAAVNVISVAVEEPKKKQQQSKSSGTKKRTPAENK